MLDQRYSDNEQTKRDIPSFIEPMPPLISNPFMRPRPQKGTNLLELFEEDSELEEEPELVQVYLRLKPHVSAANLYEVKSDRCLITSVDTATAGHGRRTQHNVSKMYTFSHIFDQNASQKEIFEKVVKDNLKKLPDGHSFTLLTYGASGSGKTYTLMGTVASPGLVPRSLECVFRVVDAAQLPLFKPADGGAEKLDYAEQEYELQWVKRLRHVSAPLRDKYRRMSTGLCKDFTVSSLDLSNRTRHYVWVSFVEIYNEGVYDLLAVSDRSNASKLRIREDPNGHVYVKGASQAFVRSGSEAYDVMAAGKHQLQVAATGVHAHSSRSHCIFTITMLTETDNGVRTSCVRLCDLAGCERARHTRNTGVRMAESRAINSSLHVLERCLHTLRRRQRNRAPGACVPYRESKLTRLLGAGLSGARGESVAMVVTLNPAPEYAHETKHVLQLAAVARDIQINSTISDSTLESSCSTQDTNTTMDLMRLRSVNERLHFELLQAQAHNKELLAAMEEKQQEAANTMRELVEEAKDMTRQYYEAQLQSLRAEMDDMVEEYESRLSKATNTASNNGTPSRSLQNKVAQLMTDIAILEEKLTAERLARARAEDEVQHLRACIEERDEKAFEEETSNNHSEVVSLSESDRDSDEEMDDPCNESLEPTFKKEDINRSRLMITCVDNNSLHYDSTEHSFHDNTEQTKEDFGINSVLNCSNVTLKDNEKSVHVIDENDDSTKKINLNNLHLEDEDNKASIAEVDVHTSITIDRNYDVNLTENPNDAINKCDASNRNAFINVTPNKDGLKSLCFETKSNESRADNKVEKDNLVSKSLNRDTYFLTDKNIKSSESSEDDLLKTNLINIKKNISKDVISTKDSEKLVSKIIESVKSKPARDASLAQFELLEKAANHYDTTKVGCNDFGNVKILNEKRHYFDVNTSDVVDKEIKSSKANKEKNCYLDNKDEIIEKAEIKKEKDTFTEVNKQLDNTRSPSIIKDEVLNDYKPSKLKILLGENLTKQSDGILSVHANNLLLKKYESIDIFEGLDSPHFNVKNSESHDIVENAVKSIKKLVSEQKSASKTNTKNDVIVQKAIPEETAQKSNDISLLTEKSVKGGDQVEDRIKLDNEGVISPNEIKAESNVNNTIEEFENIYKDISAPRATEFDLLIPQEISIVTNLEKEVKSSDGETKDKSRHKSKDLRFADRVCTAEVEEVLLESHAKSENRTKPTKRSLRLRKRKNQIESEEKSDQENDIKLMDIVNLQKEFSDVCLGVPAPMIAVKDIVSPKKIDGANENVPPVMGIQSCPSKSVTRSRRKLFTPRAEPLDEDEAPGDSSERLYVPRPSYHRTRARRKL